MGVTKQPFRPRLRVRHAISAIGVCAYARLYTTERDISRQSMQRCVSVRRNNNQWRDACSCNQEGRKIFPGTRGEFSRKREIEQRYRRLPIPPQGDPG